MNSKTIYFVIITKRIINTVIYRQIRGKKYTTTKYLATTYQLTYTLETHWSLFVRVMLRTKCNGLYFWSSPPKINAKTMNRWKLIVNCGKVVILSTTLMHNSIQNTWELGSLNYVKKEVPILVKNWLLQLWISWLMMGN